MKIVIQSKNQFFQLFSLLLVSIMFLAAYSLLINFVPIADLAKEFGVPGWAAAWVLWALDAGTTVTAIVSFITALGTGGLSLVAAAGTMGVKKYLKDKLKEKGEKAFIAW